MIIKNIKGETLYISTGHTINSVIEEAVANDIDLIGADLSGADLSDANLSNANLSNANLNGANLSNANLSGADLFGAHLIGANLRGSNLFGAHLIGANLSGANLSDANLIGADLPFANLSGANISNANISNANLSGAENMPNIPMACPESGEFIGWKKIHYYKELYYGSFIVKLLIPEDAKRCSATTNKCRCDKAKVLEIRSIRNGKTVDIITNMNYEPCVYKVGEMVYPDSFDEDRWDECSNGIHFFVEEKDAFNY